MEIIFVIMPVAVFIGIIFLAALLWGVKSGQWDDMVGPAYRVLDDERPVSASRKE